MVKKLFKGPQTRKSVFGVPLIIAVVVFSLAAGGTSQAARTGGAVRNPVVGSPVGSGAVPPSSIRSGLVPTVSPIDRSSNRVVTGNIGGGRHFRGVVPYNAVTDFAGTLGSTSLDSFLRRSAGLGWRKPVSYYSQTATVATTRAGSHGVFRPPTARLDNRADGGFSLRSALPKKTSATGPYGESVGADNIDGAWQWGTVNLEKGAWRPQSIPNIRSRPMANTAERLEKLLSGKISDYQQERRLKAEQREQKAKFWFGIEQAGDKAAESKKDLIGKEDSLKPAARLQPDIDVLEPFKPLEPGRQVERVEEQKQLDVYEQMKRQIGDLRQEPFTTEKPAKRPSGEDEKKLLLQGRQEEKFSTQKLAEADLAAVKAKTILGKHETFASFSKDKFNRYLRAGENYLKQGKYHRAADAFTMASIYKPSDPLAYAGKAHALFAAGEYMSSALFLFRTLEIFPEYARFKVDLEGMVGDRDKLESRIVDVEQWLKKSGAGELQFLLGYVYYQLDRLERGRRAIDAAYQKMPDSPAVAAVKKAIDDAIKAAER